MVVNAILKSPEPFYVAALHQTVKNCNHTAPSACCISLRSPASHMTQLTFNASLLQDRLGAGDLVVVGLAYLLQVIVDDGLDGGLDIALLPLQIMRCHLFALGGACQKLSFAAFGSLAAFSWFSTGRYIARWTGRYLESLTG